MDFAVKHAEEMNGNTVELQKMNKVRKFKRAMLPFELFSLSGGATTSRVRDMNEVSNVRCTPSQGAESRRHVKHKKLNKSYSKSWSKFMQQLWNNKMKTANDVKEECEQTWEYDYQTKCLCAKIWDNEHNACDKVESNEMVNAHEASLKNYHLSEKCTVMS